MRVLSVCYSARFRAHRAKKTGIYSLYRIKQLKLPRIHLAYDFGSRQIIQDGFITISNRIQGGPCTHILTGVMISLQLLNDMVRLARDLIPADLFVGHAQLLVRQQANFDHDPVKSIAIFFAGSSLISEDLVHFLESQILGFRDKPVDEDGSEDAHQPEEDKCAVAHGCDHQRCSLADLKRWSVSYAIRGGNSGLRQSC